MQTFDFKLTPNILPLRKMFGLMNLILLLSKLTASNLTIGSKIFLSSVSIKLCESFNTSNVVKSVNAPDSIVVILLLIKFLQSSK